MLTAYNTQATQFDQTKIWLADSPYAQTMGPVHGKKKKNCVGIWNLNDLGWVFTPSGPWNRPTIAR